MNIWIFEIQEWHLFSPDSLECLKGLNGPDKNKSFIQSYFWFTAAGQKFVLLQTAFDLAVKWKISAAWRKKKKDVYYHSELNSLFESFLFWGCFWLIVNAYWEADSGNGVITDMHFQENSLAWGSPAGVWRFCASFMMQGKSLGVGHKMGLRSRGVLLCRHQPSLCWRTLCDELISVNVLPVCSQRYYRFKSSSDRPEALSIWNKYEHPVSAWWGGIVLQ